MKRFLIKRIFQLIPVLLGITVIAFFLLHMIPGDPAVSLLGTEASTEEIERVRDLMGLNDPLYMQLAHYIFQVIQGDLGTSIIQKEPVLSLIMKSFPATLELAVFSLLISLIIAIPLGIIAAVKKQTVWDYISMFFAQLGVSMPVFWTGILFIMLFSLKLNWFPTFGRGEPLFDGLVLLLTEGNGTVLLDSLKKIFLPALSLGVMGAALITRMVRSMMVETLNMDYIRTARAKGTLEFKVIMKHAFRNALLPVITIVGLEFGGLLGGAIITETVFAWPGIGRLVITAISQRDFPVIQGIVLTVAVCFTLINLLVDILYAVINPRIRNN